MKINRLASYKTSKTDALVIGYGNKTITLKHSQITGYNEEQIIIAINALANTSQISLPEFGIHINRDGSLCIWTGSPPETWPENN